MAKMVFKKISIKPKNALQHSTSKRKKARMKSNTKQIEVINAASEGAMFEIDGKREGGRS